MDDRVYFPVSRGGGGCMRISQAIHLFINDRKKKRKKKKKKNKLVNEAKVKPEILVFFAIKSTTPSPISPVSTRSFDPVFRNMKRSSQPCNFKFDEFSINRRQIKGHSNLSPPFPFPSPSPFFTNVVLVTADCLDDDSDTNWKRDNASLYGTRRQPERESIG